MDIWWVDNKENGNHIVELSVEHVVFDHKCKCRKLCDLVSFIEVWYVFKCKIVNKASKISFVVLSHKLMKIGQHLG